MRAWLLCGLLLLHSSIFAGTDTHQNPELIDFLMQEKINYQANIDAIIVQPLPTQMAMTLNKAKIATLKNFLANQKEIKIYYAQQLKHYEKYSLAGEMPVASQERINKLVALSDKNKATIDLIEENLALANRYQTVLETQSTQYAAIQLKHSLFAQFSRLRMKEVNLNRSITQLYQKNIELQQSIQVKKVVDKHYRIEGRILYNNQLINLYQYQIIEVHLKRSLLKADALLLESPDLHTLQIVTDTYQTTINKLVDTEESLKQMLLFIGSSAHAFKDADLSNQAISLMQVINVHITAMKLQQKQLQKDLENHQIQLKTQLAIRKGLSEYRMSNWPNILSEIIKIPTQFYQYCDTLLLKCYAGYKWISGWSLFFMLATIAVMFFTGYAFKQLLKRICIDRQRSRLSGRLYDGALVLLLKNCYHITAIIIINFLFYFNHIPKSNYNLIIQLLSIWIFFRVAIHIARLMLLERLSDTSGKDVFLYYRLKWLLLAGGWSTALMVVSHSLPLSLLLQDLFNRLFMLFLVAVSIVSWLNQDAIVHLFDPILSNAKRYLRNAVMMLIVLMPLTLFTSAIIGLIGYTNLAWTMSTYQVKLLMLIALYVLVRGLIFELLDIISEAMISHLSNGWLWTEIFLKPMDKVLRTLLFLCSVYLLFQVFDWDTNSTIIAHIKVALDYIVVDVSGIHITPKSMLEFFMLLFFCIWAAKWTREFCYRWLYREVKDAGLRNSFAVFTQYAVVLIGGFIALHVLGLEFSGMSMILGGLAVGMGFGLRDFASNIVGGLMLLIERPVREGDLITIGEYEGKVAHIGIRSMRVSSWDNMEVLIPNAETFNKPFTNWTHQDSIVRTVAPIKVSRSDDPIIVRQILLDVMDLIPEILVDPPFQVILKQIDEALLEFEIRYFINVDLHARFEVRSKLFFAIMERFKEYGIQPPIPPLSVEIKQSPLDTKKIDD